MNRDRWRITHNKRVHGQNNNVMVNINVCVYKQWKSFFNSPMR